MSEERTLAVEDDEEEGVADSDALALAARGAPGGTVAFASAEAGEAGSEPGMVRMSGRGWPMWARRMEMTKTPIQVRTAP